jgi:ubiquinone/menaquinone biosynthesis C-methylase UbiE
MSDGGQDLANYWDEDFAKVLETWGESSAWKEIEMIMADREGAVLDIACGTGKAIEMLSRFDKLVLYGCDISDLLIQKALERGIAAERLKVCDATRTGYSDAFFAYAYSIGSLEHFTEEGISKVISECRRIVARTVFHQVPVSRTNQNEGWIKPLQSYYNNSVDWWLKKFRVSYKEVYVVDSLWQDRLSVGKWFICK